MHPFNEVLIFRRTPQETSTTHDSQWTPVRRAPLRFVLFFYFIFPKETSFNCTLVVTTIPICHYRYYYHGLFCTHLNLGNEDQLLNWIPCILR